MAAGTGTGAGRSGTNSAAKTAKDPAADAAAKKATEDAAKKRLQDLQKEKADREKRAAEEAKKKADEKKRTDEEKAATAKAAADAAAKSAAAKAAADAEKKKQATNATTKTPSGQTKGGSGQKNVKNESNSTASHVHGSSPPSTGTNNAALAEQMKLKAEADAAAKAKTTAGTAATGTGNAAAGATEGTAATGTAGTAANDAMRRKAAEAAAAEAAAKAKTTKGPAIGTDATGVGSAAAGATEGTAATGDLAREPSLDTRYQQILKDLDEKRAKNVIESKKIVAKPPFSRSPREKDTSAAPTPSKIKVLKYSGLPNEAPSIILNSEFLPIYEKGDLTRIGDILNLKENARILNAQNAITVLHSTNLKERVVKPAQDSIKATLPIVTDSFLNKIFPKFKELDAALNVNKPLKDKYPVEEDFPTEEEDLAKLSPSKNSFSNELARLGIRLVGNSKYENVKDYLIKKGIATPQGIKTFPDTELWIKTLNELKFSLSVSSIGTSNSSFNSIASSDKNLQAKDSLWINNGIKMPDTYANIVTTNPLSSLSTKDSLSIYTEQVEKPLLKLFTFTEKQSIFIDRPIGGKNNKEIAEAVNWNGTDYTTAFEDAIPRAVARISDVLQREKSYGKTINDYSSALKARGFETAPDGMNVSVWDHLVGVVPEKTFEMPENPIGKGLSLMSLAHEYASIGQDKYSVFTFERDNSPLGDTQSPKITTGREYYLETSLNINANGDAYDLSRINRLKKRLEDAVETTKILEDFVNTYNDDLNNSQNAQENFLPQYLNQRFKSIFTSYVKILDISDKKNIKTDTSKFSDWTPADNHNRFFAMLIKKIAGSMFQTDPIKGHAARRGAVSLWVMCICFVLDEASVTEGNFLYKHAVDNLMESLTSLCGHWQSDQLKSLDSFDEISNVSSFWVNAFDQNLAFELETIKKEIFYEKSNILLTFMQTFKEEYNIYPINTEYSGIDKNVYMVAYMTNMMLTISCLTHESLDMAYVATKKLASTMSNFKVSSEIFRNRSLENTNYWSVGTGAQGVNLNNAFGDSTFIFTTSFFNKSNPIDHSTIWGFTADKNGVFNKYLFKAKTYMKQEMKELLSEVFMIKGFVTHALNKINSFIELLSNNFKPYLDKTLPYFYENNNFTIDQKISLFNASSTEEQMIMSNYIYSEISDRISKENDGQNKLKSIIPSFNSNSMANLPFGSYLPVNDLEICSFPIVKTYFNNEIFYKKDGNNKRIISVGIPPKMMRNLMSYDSQDFTSDESIKKNIVRIKIFKIDLLHRYLVFKPLSYLFDLNRFPTRVIGNWDASTLKNGTNNPLELPTKYWTGDRFELHTDASDPKIAIKYGSSLSTSESLEIYENHAKSFLAEEYIRWMTGVSIDETRYYNYEPMSKELSYLNEGYGKFASLASTAGGVSAGTNRTTYVDPVTGVTREVPVNGSQQERNAAAAATNQNNLPTIDVTSTLISYLHNETFILRPAQILKKAVYPRKFDRTFSIIFDPDDFIIDTSMMEPGKSFAELKPQIDSLKNQKFIIPHAPKSNRDKDKFLYKLRDITPDDVYMDEYFITIEPFLGIS